VDRVDIHGWTVTVDAAFPTGVFELGDESIHRFLDSIERYRGALTLAHSRPRGLAVTLSIDAAELEKRTSRHAAARAEAIVREHLPAIGAGDHWLLNAIEVSANDELATVHVFACNER
jgi:hypothetical protein